MAAGYHSVTPYRSYDSRKDPTGGWGPDEAWYVPVDAPGMDWSTVTAVAVNITVTQPTTTSYLTAYPGYPSLEDRPVVSNLNFVAGQTVSNLAIVPTVYDPDTLQPYIAIYNRAGYTHAILDIQGWYDDATLTDGLRLQPLDPVRIRDTRTGVGGTTGAVAAGTYTTAPTGTFAAGALAVIVNITGTQPATGTYLTAWPGPPVTRPTASTLNLAPGQTAANLSMVPTAYGATGGIGVESFAVYNAVGSTQVVADLNGYFY